MNKIGNLTSPLIWGICSVAAGLVLIIYNESILRWIFIILGALLFIYGAVPVVQAFFKKQSIPIVASLCAICGLVVMILNTSLTAILFVVLGILLMLAGVQNIASLINIKRHSGLSIPFTYFLIPILCIAGGVVSIWNPFAAQSSLISFIGWCILVQGVSNLASLLVLKLK